MPHNPHLKPATPEQRRQVVMRIRADESDEAIAKAVGLHQSQVAAHRRCETMGFYDDNGDLAGAGFPPIGGWRNPRWRPKKRRG